MEKLKIKGFKSGLNLVYSNSLSFDEAKEVTASKFEASRKFFGNAAMAIKFTGRSFSEEEQNQLCDIISDNSDIDIACIINDELTENSIYDGALRIVKAEMEKNDICFYKKSVINGQMIKSKKDIVIIGDVNPGCSLVSDSSIYVYGGLYGEAYAGENGIIAAIELSPEQLGIGDTYYEPPKRNFWGHKTRLLPSIAHKVNGRIVTEAYTKELIDRLAVKNEK